MVAASEGNHVVENSRALYKRTVFEMELFLFEVVLFYGPGN
jgi:hypothetical protein